MSQMFDIVEYTHRATQFKNATDVVDWINQNKNVDYNFKYLKRPINYSSRALYLCAVYENYERTNGGELQVGFVHVRTVPKTAVPDLSPLLTLDLIQPEASQRFVVPPPFQYVFRTSSPVGWVPRTFQDYVVSQVDTLPTTT